jgi:hypothetical protein
VWCSAGKYDYGFGSRGASSVIRRLGEAIKLLPKLFSVFAVAGLLLLDMHFISG